MNDNLPNEELTEEQETIEISASDRQEIDIETPEEVQAVGYNGPLKKKVYAGMWGPIEIGLVALAAFLLLLSSLIYLFLVVPANSELASDRTKRDELDTKLREAQKKYGDMGTTESEVTKLVNSAEDFEFRFLQDQKVGASAIYQRLNALITAYGLRNTAGPDYEPLLLGERKAKADEGEKTGRDKFRSIFPGIYITATVEGPYPNLRRFLKELETSREFMAVTAVELEPSDEEQAEEKTTTREVLDENKRKVQKQFRLGKTRGNRVNLRIEMAAYFRRDGVTRAPVEETVPEAD